MTSIAPCRSPSEPVLITDVSCCTFAAEDIASPGRMPSAALRTAGSLSASAVFITSSMSLTFNACSARSDASRTSTDASPFSCACRVGTASATSRRPAASASATRISGALSAFGSASIIFRIACRAAAASRACCIAVPR